MGHRTPQLGTRTYYKIHALCKIFALHKIFVLGNFSFFFVFFSLFFFSFFLAKIAWNHVFWNMGKVAVFRETSVVAHTIAFQAILAKKKKKEKKSSAGWNVIIFWYMMEKTGVGFMGKVEGGHAYCFIFAFQKISALQGWHRTLSVELFCHGRKQDRRWFVFPDPVVQSSLRGHKDVKKDGDGAADERPAKRART